MKKELERRECPTGHAVVLEKHWGGYAKKAFWVVARLWPEDRMVMCVCLPTLREARQEYNTMSAELDNPPS